MKRILLTGATGFVGSHVARLLREAGHEVIALVRTSSQENYLRYLGIKLVYGALEDPLLNKISQQLHDIDAVIHLAGIIKARKNSDFEKINTEGTANFYSLCKKIGSPRFVFVSSIAARGPNRQGINDHDLQPVSHYGRSKRMAEDLLLKEKNGPKIVIVRPPVVYGPGDRETLTLFRFIEKGYFPIVGSGSKRVSFVYVEDLAKLLIRAALNPGKLAGPYYPEDGSGGYSWLQLHLLAQKVSQKKLTKIWVPLFAARVGLSFAALFAKLKGKTALIPMDKFSELKQQAWTCSVKDFLNDLSYQEPLVSLDIGLGKAQNWYREKGWL